MKTLFTISLLFISINIQSQIPDITVIQSNNPSPGKMFMGNVRFDMQPDPNYLLIVNNDGSVYWSRQMSTSTYDFKIQPNGLLSYFPAEFRGNLNLPRAFYTLDSGYNIVDTFKAFSPPNDTFWTDNHECKILSNGHALILAFEYRWIDMSVIVPGGNPNARVEGYIIQEVDKNNNLFFQWKSLDYFLITDAVHENLTAAQINPVHTNAMEIDYDGNILISSRCLSEITKINRFTGAIIWRLGGEKNQYTFTNDSGFSYQHDIRRLPNGNITLFDNGNFKSPQESRAVEYQLDEVNKICTRVWEYRHNPPIYALAMGSVQRLSNGNSLISWGSVIPTLTEVTPSGQTALELAFPPSVYTYRTFKGDWPVPPTSLITLDLTAIPQGFYNPALNKMRGDTVSIYLRNAASPYNLIDSSENYLDSNGNGTFSFTAVNGAGYYLVVKHRNSIETWSGSAVSFISNQLIYNFTTSSAKSFGNNSVQVDNSPVRYALFGGDVNQDSFIDGADLSAVDNDAFSLVFGYVSTDVNGDNFVDASDLSIVDNNAFNLVSVVRP
ncbi:MAG: arylsulfotransferase family protein [Ignavibacteria bacterium]